MNTRYDDEIERALGDYREQLARAGETTRALREVRAEAVSPRRQVAVTVGSQGELLELSFPSDSYREMAPKELATLIVETVATARRDAMSQVTALVAPGLPAGLDAVKLMSGNIDPAEILGRGPRPAEAVAEYLKREPGASR